MAPINEVGSELSLSPVFGFVAGAIVLMLTFLFIVQCCDWDEDKKQAKQYRRPNDRQSPVPDKQDRAKDEIGQTEAQQKKKQKQQEEEPTPSDMPSYKFQSVRATNNKYMKSPSIQPQLEAMTSLRLMSVMTRGQRIESVAFPQKTSVAPPKSATASKMSPSSKVASHPEEEEESEEKSVSVIVLDETSTLDTSKMAKASKHVEPLKSAKEIAGVKSGKEKVQMKSAKEVEKVKSSKESRYLKSAKEIIYLLVSVCICCLSSNKPINSK